MVALKAGISETVELVQVGIAVRSAQSGHLPSVPFSLVTLATTFAFLVGWRSALAAALLLAEAGRGA